MWKTCKNEEKKIFHSFKEQKINIDKKKDIKKKYSNPLQDIKVIGKSIKIENIYQVIENKKNFIPLQGNSNKLVDSYDARHILGSLNLPKSDNNSLTTIIGLEIPIKDDNENLLNYYRYHYIIESMKNNISEEECIERVENNIEKNILFDPIKYHKEHLNSTDITNNSTENGTNYYSPNTINSFAEQYLIKNYVKISNDILNPKKILENQSSDIEICISNDDENKKLLQKKSLELLLFERKQEEQENIDINNLSPMELIKYKTRMKLQQVTITKETNILINVNKSTPNSNHPFKYNIMESKSLDPTTNTTTTNLKTNKQTDKNSTKNVNTSKKRNREKNKSKPNNNSGTDQIQSHLDFQKSTNTKPTSYCYNIYDKRHKFTVF